ncbi:hypothetical protein SLEP1_g53223 [Rubroshorea leprosula]|uniref:DUF7086 domain-containing protein n=1 Tax=Rubroshorea leprosula TaxID=152421 RepID=A0AAV5MB47_9ROSI|nr:hypothetical protein SLEP1_g53223 [Rubroshorea leprosula]
MVVQKKKKGKRRNSNLQDFESRRYLPNMDDEPISGFWPDETPSLNGLFREEPSRSEFKIDGAVNPNLDLLGEKETEEAGQPTETSSSALPAAAVEEDFLKGKVLGSGGHGKGGGFFLNDWAELQGKGCSVTGLVLEGGGHNEGGAFGEQEVVRELQAAQNQVFCSFEDTISGIRSGEVKVISGEVECMGCRERYIMEIALHERFAEMHNFIESNMEHHGHKITEMYSDLSCTHCGKKLVIPVGSRNMEANDSYWLVLFLLKKIGNTTVQQRLAFMKRLDPAFKNPVNRDKLLFQVYYQIYKQVYERF